MFRWAIDGKLARGPRPGFWMGHARVPKKTVDAWINAAKKLGIRSVICLITENQLRVYEKLPTDLIPYYQSHGLKAMHIPCSCGQRPPLSKSEFKEVWKTYKRFQKPVLIHCSAGVSRTGAAVSHLKRSLSG